MFSLHETTRKRTCRTAFFALCLAPTCATAAWIADHHLPWRDAAAARQLSDRYHLDVTLTDWQDPRPSMTRLAGVTIAEPGVAAPLLKLTGVESHQHGDALILSIDELTLAVADLPALAARLEWSLTRTTAAKIELHIRKLALLTSAGSDAPVTLHQLHGVIQRGQRDLPRLQLIAHLAEQPAADAKPIGLAVAPTAAPTSGEEAGDEEKLGAAAPGQVVTFNTQQNAIPVALLAPLVPAAAFNDSATFTGVVTWHANAAGALGGRLDGIDLAGILPRNSPHILTGKAVVELTDCRWQGEQFQRLAGTFTAVGAEANGSLLIAAPTYLACSPGDALQPLQAAVVRIAEQRRVGGKPSSEDEAFLAEKYELSHLACRFTLDAAGLAIEPYIPAASTLPAGTFAAIKDQPALFCRQLTDASGLAIEPYIPAVAWLQFIASPAGPYWIPFTPATLETARRLPSPQ
jgi:hypothetical protein